MPSHDRDSGIPELLRRRLRVGLVLVAGGFALLAAGCGGDGSDDPESFPPIDADVDASTSQPSASAVDSDAGDGVTASSSTSVVTGATTADGTTEKPDLDIPTEWDSDLDEIFGRYQLYWEALDIAMGPPEADPDYPPLREFVDAGVYEEVRQQIREFRNDRKVLVYREDSIADHVLRLPNPGALAKAEGNEVIIQDCWVDDSQVQSLDGQVLNTYRESVLRNVTMRVVEGQWRVWASIDASEDSDGYEECKSYIDELS